MDTWADGDHYERYMGRWSTPMAREFLAWLHPMPDARWLDVGCGNGALSAAIMETCRPSHLAGIDASADFAAAARRRLGPDPDLRVGDAQSLPFGSGVFDVAVSGLCLNFVPDPAAAVSEMRRVTGRDGIVAGYVWDYAVGMEMIRRFWDVAIDLDPAVRHLDEAVRFPLCRPEPLMDLFRVAELDSVRVAELEIPTRFSGFDDYWRPFLGGQGPAPGYVNGLDTDARDRLAATLETALVPDPDGAIVLTARAWAVQGTVPR